MTIADGLVLLANTKEDLRVKLDMPKSAPFSTYVDSPLIPFTPRKLFATGEQGVWYDPSDLSSMYQDAAMTIPVTASGDPVGAMMDLSGNGNHAIQSVSAYRPIYQTDGILHWLQFDGVDDALWFAINNRTNDMYVGIVHQNYGDTDYGLIAAQSGNSRIILSLGSNISLFHPVINDTYVCSINNIVVSEPNNRVGSGIVGTQANQINTVTEIDAAELNQTAFDYLQIGAMSNGYRFKGRVSSVVICAKPDTTNRSKITQYLAQKSGVTL